MRHGWFVDGPLICKSYVARRRFGGRCRRIRRRRWGIRWRGGDLGNSRLRWRRLGRRGACRRRWVDSAGGSGSGTRGGRRRPRGRRRAFGRYRQAFGYGRMRVRCLGVTRRTYDECCEANYDSRRGPRWRSAVPGIIQPTRGKARVGRAKSKPVHVVGHCSRTCSADPATNSSLTRRSGPW